MALREGAQMVDIGNEFSHWTVILAEVVGDIVLLG